jgi:ferredoxin
LNEEGYISVEEINVPPGMEALARRGARACPERIIVIEEDDN